VEGEILFRGLLPRRSCEFLKGVDAVQLKKEVT